MIRGEFRIRKDIDKYHVHMYTYIHIDIRLHVHVHEHICIQRHIVKECHAFIYVGMDVGIMYRLSGCFLEVD